MEAMVKDWTNERLEERFDATGRCFDRVDADIRELRSEMNTRFDRVGADMQAIAERIDALQRTMLQLGGGAIVALLGLIATQL
jgi:hypothetical protein